MAEPTEGYFAALGEFIHIFSETERLMQEAVRHYARTPQKIGRAIFSGSRAKDCADHINRILDATEQAGAKAQLQDAFAQLGHIIAARNSIVHWGAKMLPNLTVVPKKVRTYAASPDDLARMKADLFKIGMHIKVAMAGGIEGVPLSGHRLIIKVLEGAWLYKPPPQGDLPKTPRALRPTPKAPPRS
jgi:hypothetical protein